LFGQTPIVLHRLNFTARLSSINKLSALGLTISFFDMGHQGAAFLVSPAFFGILRFQGAPEDVFNVL
jgi:hypothetical protein